MKKTTVVLVEDERLVRMSVRKILEGSGFSVEGEAATAKDGVEAALREKPDICLVDIRLPDGSGIDVAREVAKRAPDTAVVMLSASDVHNDLIDSIRAGAVGYLLKGMDPDRLAHALAGVVKGEAAIPRPLMVHLVKALQTQERRRAVVGKRGAVDLSAREWEVLDLLCEGLSTRQIAERLSLSPVTIRRHITGMVRKLGVRDRSEAVALLGRTSSPKRK